MSVPLPGNRAVPEGDASRKWSWWTGIALLLGIAAAVTLSFSGMSLTRAQEEPLPGHASPAPAAEVKPSAPRSALDREIAQQKRQHRERLEELKALQEALRASQAPQERIDAVDRLMAKEQRDFNERIQFLVQLLQSRRVEPPVRERPARDRVRSALESELGDIAGAIGSLNQSYAIAPVIGPGAATGGSVFIDRTDVGDRVIDRRDDLDDDLDDDVDDDLRADRNLGRHLLPAPRVLGGCGTCYVLPGWLYGEVPGRWDRGGVDRAVVVELLRDLRDMRREVERLRAEVRRLESKLPEKDPSPE